MMYFWVIFFIIKGYIICDRGVLYQATRSITAIIQDRTVFYMSFSYQWNAWSQSEFSRLDSNFTHNI